MPLTVEPDNAHPLPDSFKDQIGESFKENARIAVATASLMSELGMPFEMTEEDESKAQELFRAVDVKKKPGTPTIQYNPPELYNSGIITKLSALITEYDRAVIADAAQARTYITNRLLEISTCGDSKHELRALELLGKMSDIGAFTEKSEITITHKTADDLKKAIQEKISRLLNADVVDVEAKNIEDELGLTEKQEGSANADEPAGTADSTDDAAKPS